MTTLTKTLFSASCVLTTLMLFQLQRTNSQKESLRILAQETEGYEAKNQGLREKRDRSLETIAICRNAIDAAQHLAGNTPGNSELNAWLGRVDRLKKLLHAAPEKGIPEMQFLKSNDWFSVTLENSLDTDAKIRTALSELRSIAKGKVSANLMIAVQAYGKSHGRPPPDPFELRPYLNPILSDEILQRYQAVPEVAGKNDANGAMRNGTRIMGSGRIVLEEKAPVDEDYDTWIVFTEKGNAAEGSVSQIEKAVNQAMQAFNKANNGHDASTPEELLPYFPIPVEPTRLKEYWEVSRR